MRTNWRDLTAHHCPRFGVPRTVALPLQAPKTGAAATGDASDGAAAAAVSDYRLQLSFDGDRLATPWVRVIGGGRAGGGMPLVTVTLRAVGRELKGVRAEVAPLPDDLLLAHADLYDEFRNASHWPKHVLLRYEFEAAPAAALDAGLCVVVAAGARACVRACGLRGVGTVARCRRGSTPCTAWRV